MSDTLTNLQKELERYQEANASEEKAITKSREAIYWNNKRIKLIQQQIEKTKESEPSSAQVLSDLSSNGLK